MATIGMLVAFNPKNQTWDKSNGIDDAEKHRAILISVIGAATYGLMRNLSPGKPKDKTFQELLNETIMEYVAQLHHLAKDCNYGNTLQQMLRDRIVFGIRDDRIQRHLLSEIDLTFDKALSIADLQTSGATTKFFSLTKGQQESRTFNGESKECYCCKGTKHTAADCTYNQGKCHACGRVGHIARACRSKTKLNQKYSHYSTHNVGEKADNSKTEDDSFTLNCVKAWLEEIKLDWSEVKNRRNNRKLHQVKATEKTLQQVLSKHEDVFKKELGTLKGMKAAIHVKSVATPRFFRPRSEIDRLLTEGIISPVKYPEWAAPVMPLLKPTGTIRLCGDYKLTVNTVASLERYPIPRMEDLFATLSGGKQFSKVDMSHAYQQILLDDKSKKYVTVNTSRGLFTYNRLHFGVGSAPAILQRTMERLLKGIPQVSVYLDDILVTGVDGVSHLQNLDEVLTRLEEAGLRLKRCKCAFVQEKVEYLGHIVDAQGLHPVEKKVKAIMDAPTPTNVTESKAYLGLLNDYNKFLPNPATLLAPLHEPLRHEVRWTWQKRQEEAFQKTKNLLSSVEVLVHYCADRELVLSCDASPYGIGAVLSHKMEDGSEHTLSPAEKKYSQFDKEGLAVIFGIEKSHKYLNGRIFTIYTDHKPLISLFNEKKPIPPMGSPRVQRWAMILSAYEYNIRYKPGKHHENADALSRLARSYVWWPGMDETIEREVQACEECHKHHKSPPTAPLHPWEWPESPWSRIHMFLIIVDAHSKWMDVYPVKSLASQVTIEKLRQSFCVYGPPKMLVSDNGTCFTSAEFESFMKQNGIDHSFGPKWIPAVIVRALGPVIVTIGSGQTVKWNVDQVRARVSDTVPSTLDREVEPFHDTEAVPERCFPSELDTSPQPPSSQLPHAPETHASGNSSVALVLRRSQRERCPLNFKGLC
ncbi:hypothetical protein ACER0C_003238 [Sarotherodon galilaeus]